MVDIAESRFGLTSARPGSSFLYTASRGGAPGVGSNPYPNPFLDIAGNYMPRRVSQLFDQCEYYGLTHPLLGAIIWKMSSYGVTDLIYETSNEGLREKYEQLWEKDLKLRPFLVDVLLDYHAYGNAFVSVLFPFRKWLICRSCGEAVPVDRARYRFQNYKFRMTCRHCGVQTDAKVKDVYSTNPKGIRLHRWYPKHIGIEPAGVHGEYAYRYYIPKRMRNDIVVGKASVVQNTPQVFIDAMRKNVPILFRPGQLFHLKRGSISREEQGWGMPLIFNALKDAFYMQVLKKGQEAIALGHASPLRVLFPQAASEAGDPLMNIDLGQWQEQVKEEITRWRKDPNYMPVMPLPIGYQSIGGDARALLLHNEIRIWSEYICAACNVPVELVFGGMSWSGSSVSLRMLENLFLGVREDAMCMIEWAQKKICPAIEMPIIPTKFKPFKMADDLQRAAFDMQLVGAKMLSKKTLLEARDYDFVAEQAQVRRELDDELEIQRKQAVFSAGSQGMGSLIQSQYQAKAQAMMQSQMPQPGQPGQGPQQPGQGPQQPGQGLPQPAQEAPQPGAPGQATPGPPQAVPGQPSPLQAGTASPFNVQTVGGGYMQQAQMGPPNEMDKRLWAAQIAQSVERMTTFDRYSYLNNLRTQDPDLHWLVAQYLEGGRGVDMRPLPEQLPPRRGPENAQI